MYGRSECRDRLRQATVVTTDGWVMQSWLRAWGQARMRPGGYGMCEEDDGDDDDDRCTVSWCRRARARMGYGYDVRR